MHRTDYELIATAMFETKPQFKGIAGSWPEHKIQLILWTDVCKTLAKYLKEKNNNFERDIFLDYCWEGSYSDIGEVGNPFR